ncbi:MAG: hypothetical protein R3360_08675, partial [Alphaproteobacteria bacterium]|nr:hypothetical protein [Alphaproteobacteria bacterium]
LADHADTRQQHPARGAAEVDVLADGDQPDAPLVELLDVLQKLAEITEARESTQPIKEKTGGSTFKNPPGEKAWQLIDAVGGRGLRRGGAQISERHCNFLINTGTATSADLEELGEEVRRRVIDRFGITLEWEIRRVGEYSLPEEGAVA